MDYRELLNTSDSLKVQIIQIFFLSDSPVSKKVIKDRFDIAFPTIRTYISEINNEIKKVYPNKFFIAEVDGLLVLTKSPDINLPKIIFHYIKKSDAFKILDYILQNGKLSYTQIEEIFSISRTTVYREISHMNQFLEEFNLTFQNGKIEGTELQICYFYFQLYTQLIPFGVMVSKMKNPLLLKFMTDFEDELHLHFSLETKAKLYIWLFIVDKRYQLNGKAFDAGRKIEEHLKHFIFYHRLKDAFFKATKKAEISYSETEFPYIYLASLCFSFLPECAAEYLDWFSKDGGGHGGFPIQLAMYETDKFLKENYHVSSLSVNHFNKIRYFFLQSLFHFLFFRGFIFSYSEDHFLTEAKGQASKNFLHLAKSYLDSQKNIWKEADFSEDRPLYRDFLYHIQGTLRYVEYLTDVPLQIGLRFYGEQLVQDLIHEAWGRNVGTHVPIELSIYDKKKKYDLLISDYSLPEDRKTVIYLTSEFNNPRDIQEIKKLISVIYEKKKDNS